MHHFTNMCIRAALSNSNFLNVTPEMLAPAHNKKR